MRLEERANDAMYFMNLLYLFLGALIFTLIALDIIKTTFSSSGGGRITELVSRAVWKTFFSVSGKEGKSKLLEYAGPSILTCTLLTWVLGLWAGLFLLLLSDPDSVINSTTLSSASPLEKLYYAGFTLSTLGVGDYVASNDVWRIITSVTAFSGLAFITASLTYFVQVLSAVGLQSKLSLYINSMGKSPQQILVNSWDGKGFSSFFDNVSDICQMLMQHTVNHHSFPVIHYFHNCQPKLSVAPAVALLEEAHQLLKQAVLQDVIKSEVKMTMLQTALDSYLEMVKGSFLKNTSPQEAAPIPDIGKMEEKGVPIKNREEVEQTFKQNLKDRRRLLTSLLEMDGWSWKEVYK
ncbi:potassium channel family protein [Pontibacter mucosus]|nr:potassium channel family protein [Pontibacter mucosus]